MNRFAMLVLIVVLSGCATTSTPPPERQIEIAASNEQALSVGLDVLVERGFVIRFADTNLGRIDAVRASRPGYEVQYVIRDTPTGTQIAFSGRYGGQAIGPHRFDALLAEIAARLEEGP